MIRKLSVTALVTTTLVAAAAAPAGAQINHCALARICPDLVVASTTPTSVTIRNQGVRTAHDFAVHVAPGWLYDACNRAVPAQVRHVASLAASASLTFSVERSAAHRAVKVDWLNTVAETSETNNNGTVPGEPIIC
jgi:hypothetical protein